MQQPSTPRPKRPSDPRICETCATPFWARRDKIKAGDGRFCSRSCMLKAPRTRDMSGENNPRWLGGVTADNYRYKKTQVERYPDRNRARQAVRDAVQSGRLMRGPCADCKKSGSTFAHHEDYSKPLDVVWLCRSCHRARHGGKH